MPSLLTTSKDLASQHEFAIGEMLKVFVNRRDLIRAVEDDPFEDIVIVGSDMELEVAVSISEHFRTKRPSLSVILVRNRVDVQSLNEALKAGLRDVVNLDDATALIESVRRCKALAEQLRISTGTQMEPKHRGAVIVVFSAKGGCGKTTVATNLAIALGKSGHRTCLVDFDLQFGDVAVALQLPTSKTISDALGMEFSLDRLGVTSLSVTVNDNVDAILAPTNPTDVELISGDLGEKVILALQEEYEFIVIDSPPAFTEVMIRSFDLADMTLLLTTLDTPAIKNLVMSLKTLDALGLKHRTRQVILNRSDSRAGLTIRDVEEAVSMRVSGKLQSTVDVPASVNRGSTLVDWKPRSQFSREISRIANEIANQFGGSTYVNSDGRRK